MADRDEKNFPALPQKRQRAREEGHIARSRDLTAAISFLAGTIFFAGATLVCLSFRDRCIPRRSIGDRLAMTCRELSARLSSGRCP